MLGGRAVRTVGRMDTTTTTWDPEVLTAIAAADDLHVSPFREDGTTYGTPTWIWSVAVGTELYVRAYNGRDSRWFRAAVSQGAGRITAAGGTHEVTFAQAGPEVNSLVDAAYEAKYHGSPYLAAILRDGPTAATVRITPAVAS
jgi:hypothetical protein